MLTLFLALAVAQNAAAAPPGSPVLSAQDARFEAMVKADATYLEGALDPSLTYQHSTGVLQTKAEFIAAIREGALRYKSIEVVERRVRHYGSIAIITGVMRFQVLNGGQTIDATARFTDVYESRGGRFVQVAWQNTRVP